MNQELMTLDFWQDTVIYEGKTFPVGTLACDALNVPADTITRMNEQCEKINLLLGMLNAGQDTSALFPMAKEAALTMLEILSKTPPFSYMDIPKHMETSVYKGYKQDKIEMRGDRAEMSDFPLYLNTVAGGLDRRDQTIGGFSFVVKIYAVPVVEIIG